MCDPFIEITWTRHWFNFWISSNVIPRDPIYPTPPLGQDMTQGQFFKRSLTGLNSVFLLLD